MKTLIEKSDVLIIGSGIAGCTAALELGDKKNKVIICTNAEKIEESNTKYAQGGIVYKGKGDPKLLEQDILKAGAGLCDKNAVKILAEEGPDCVEKVLMKKLNIAFSKDSNGNLHLTKEAAHSCRRILHIQDHTGKIIEEEFIKKIKEHPYIKIYSQHTLIDLITIPHHLKKNAMFENNTYKINCAGAYVLDNKKRKVAIFIAKKTILATGGIGQLFLRTVNSVVARGDGLYAAIRAGAEIKNIEFIQFHPTSLYHRDVSDFLISEAVRGEGGKLKSKKGELFMKKYDKRGSLAPRDIVSRGILNELLQSGENYVLLDIASYLSKEKIKSLFPYIYRKCLQYNMDITEEPIPVAPSAHFLCGGIKTDMHGKTNINNLYVIGESACTGVHGANRLASTSLLECLVLGVRCARHIEKKIKNSKTINPEVILPWKYTHKTEKLDLALIRQDMLMIKSIMWNYVGIIRTAKKLKRAVEDLKYLKNRIDIFYKNTLICDELIGLRNMAGIALVIAENALKNKCSCGCHFIDNEQ